LRLAQRLRLALLEVGRCGPLRREDDITFPAHRPPPKAMASGPAGAAYLSGDNAKLNNRLRTRVSSS
jgi:hypothetical protein